MSVTNPRSDAVSTRRRVSWRAVGTLAAVACVLGATSLLLFPTTMSEEEMNETLAAHYGITPTGRLGDRSSAQRDDPTAAAINAAVARKNWSASQEFEARAHREAAWVQRFLFVGVGTVIAASVIAIRGKLRRGAQPSGEASRPGLPRPEGGIAAAMFLAATCFATFSSCGEAGANEPGAPVASPSVSAEVDALIGRLAKDEIEFESVAVRLRQIGTPAVEPLSRFLTNYAAKTREYQARSFGGDRGAPGIIFQRMKFAAQVADLLETLRGKGAKGG